MSCRLHFIFQGSPVFPLKHLLCFVLFAFLLFVFYLLCYWKSLSLISETPVISSVGWYQFHLAVEKFSF